MAAKHLKIKKRHGTHYGFKRKYFAKASHAQNSSKGALLSIEHFGNLRDESSSVHVKSSGLRIKNPDGPEVPLKRNRGEKVMLLASSRGSPSSLAPLQLTHLARGSF